MPISSSLFRCAVSCGLLGCTLTMVAQTAAPAAPAQAAPAKPVETGPHAMGLDDLNTMPRVGAPEVSPDGAWVAYTVSNIDTAEDKRVSDLWMVSWDGKQDIQLTRGKVSAGSPKWSPDGRFLAFTSARPGEAKGSQVWVLDRRGGEPYQLTDVKQNLGEYRWSPDSKTLLLTLTQRQEPEPKEGAKPDPPKPIVIDRYHFLQDGQGFLSDKQPHLYLFDVVTKKLAKLTNAPVDGKGAFGESGAEWSPDGKRIAFVSNQSATDPDRDSNTDVFVVDAVAGAAPKRVTTFAGSDRGPLLWSKDGQRIVYRQGHATKPDVYDMARLVSIPVEGGEVKMLAPKLDNWVEGPAVAVDEGAKLLVTVAEDRQQYVAELPVDGGDVKRLTMEKGVASELNEEAGKVALLWSSDAAPPEVYAFDDSPDGGKLRKLTGHTDAWVAKLKLATTEDISAKASDGSEVHGLLTMPVGYVAGTKVPMILRIHGGPTAQDAHGFDVDRQMFAGHGYAVLQVNYRGSLGRGHAYAEAISADWGHKEVLDLMAMVDAAVATGKIDADKLGVGGWSYGGILTDDSIASTTRFKAASSGAGVANLLAFYGVDQYILQYDNELGPPWKNPELYIKLSYAFFHADRIKTPTLFMGGDMDRNVPVVGGEQMYEALKSLNVPAELVVYPGEFHGFTRPSFIKDRYVRWFAWYDKYVKGVAPATPAPAPAVKAAE
jgi:dipeptidyl aminopeptidase/acylaminoacyl peptidase